MSEGELRELRELKKMVADIHQRLFYDNGRPSIQTSIAKHAQQLRLIYFIGGGLILSMIGALVSLWIEQLSLR